MLLPDTILLAGWKDALYGVGHLAQAVLGLPTAVAGLSIAATSPASLSVTIGAGSIYYASQVDSSAYGSLGADVNTVVKQGINPAPVTLAITPPAVSGYSQTYLIEAAYQDVDGGATVEPYYNSANPLIPFSGPANSGTQQYTVRTGLCAIALKPGTAAPSGSQSTPVADTGYVALYYVTVTNGQTTITSPNFSVVPGAPFVSLPLPQVPTAIQQQAGNWAVDTGTANAMAITLPAGTTLTPGMPLRIKKGSSTNTGAVTVTINGGSPVQVLWADGTQLANGDFGGSFVANAVFDGTSVRLTGGANGPTYFSRSGVYYGTDAGATNAMVVATTTSLTTLTAGTVVLVHNVVAGNTGATTLSLNSFGAKSCSMADGTAFAGGELDTGDDALFEYDGTKFRLLSMLPISFLDARYPRLAQNLYVPIAQVSTYYVNATTGNDSNPGTLISPFATIQAAINYASGFQATNITINVAAGTYNGFTVNKSLVSNWNIVGAGYATTTISATTVGVNLGRGVQVNGANVTIGGFTVTALVECLVANFGATVTMSLTLAMSFVGIGSGSYAIGSYETSQVTIQTNQTIYISGTFGYVFSSRSGAAISIGYHDVSNTFTPTINFGTTTCTAVCEADSGGSYYMSYGYMNWAGATPTGQRYACSSGGGITAIGGGVNFIPGTVAGVAAASTSITTANGANCGYYYS